MELTTKAQRHEEQPRRVGAIPTRAEEVAAQVVDAAVKVHKTLGPGLLESVYEVCLCHELSIRGITFRKQLDLPICYEGIRLESGLRIDILVDECVVVELKTVEKLLPIHEAQLLTYLKLTNNRVGFLLNFNVPLMKDGMRRLVL
jgi:GxxExxY protein